MKDKDTRRSTDLVKYYYTVMGDEKFLTVLNHYANGEGYGVENIWCVFADDYETWEDDYFGDIGIAYYFDYPAVEKDETVILDYETFFKYLKEACVEYLERNPENKKEVEGYLIEIKKRFDIVDYLFDKVRQNRS